MKKQLFISALAFVLLPFAAGAQATVLSADFEAAEFPPAGWVVLDGDGDGHSWVRYGGNGTDGHVTQFGSSKASAVSFCGQPGTSTVYGAQDNWLISPAFEVKNAVTTLAFNYVAQSTASTEPMEVLVSEGGTNPTDFTSIFFTNVENEFDWDEYETVITNKSFQRTLDAYQGKTIRVAIRHTGNGSYALSVDNFMVSDRTGPQAPTGLKVKAGDDGALTATLSWTNPSRTASGDDLADLKINIFRDGAKIATVVGEPGAEQSWTDQPAPAGTHSYQVQAENAAGAGSLTSSVSAFIGEDYPKPVSEPVALAGPGQITLTWKAPEKGAHNGVINPASLTYKVVLIGNGGAETVLGTEVKGTSFTHTDITPGEPLLYGVYACNSGGSSEISEAVGAIAYGADADVMTVGQTAERNNSLERLPISIYDNYSVTQSMYRPADFNFAKGSISKLIYKIYKGTDTELAVPVRIYMHETVATELSGWDAPTEENKVFQGTITLMQGSRDYAVELTAPYNYKGGNLVVTFIKDGKPTGSYSDRFYSVETPDVRTYYGGSTYSQVDIANLPVSSYSAKTIKQIPSTRFVMSVEGVASLTGKVANAATGAAIAGAEVAVSGYADLRTTTDAEGVYTFRYVPVDAASITVIRPGFADKTVALSLTSGSAVTLNVDMDQLANYALSGSVTTSDTKLPAEGALVTLSGYDMVSVTADAQGRWVIDPVYADKEYTLTVSYPLYDTHTATVKYSADTALEPIVLSRAIIAPLAVDAQVASDGSKVELSWKSPLENTGEPGWNTFGNVETPTGFDGDKYYSPTDYNVGHLYSAEEIAARHMAGTSVTKLRAYIKAADGTFTAKVWQGTRNDNTVLASQVIPAEALSAEGAWVEVTFDTPAEIREGQSYIVGVNAKNASGEPFGTVKDYTRGVNNLKWGEGGAGYDAYYGFCIEAFCAIPGTDGKVVGNPDVPKCEYKVYRREASSADWTELTPAPIKDAAYTDASWATILSGEYVYGVTAVYREGESAKASSIKLTRSIDTDVAVTAFITPVKSVEMQQTAVVKVTVANFGEMPAENIPVSAVLNNGTPVTATLPGPLNKGETADIEVGTLPLTEGVHTLRAYTALEGDQVASNDALEMILPNLANIALTGYRWNAYGNAGFMTFGSNNPEGAVFAQEVTPNDALLTAGEYVGGVLYAFTATWNGTPREFVKINPATWTVEENLDAHETYVTDMAYSYPTATMYALCPSDNDCALVTVDLSNGAVAPVGLLSPNMHALACNTEGKLFAAGNDGNLYSVDPATATATEIGATGVAGSVRYLQSMAFDHNSGRLFWAQTGSHADGALHEVDPATGTATLLGDVKYNAAEPSEMVALFTPYTYDGISAATTAATELRLVATATGHILVTAPEAATVEIFNPAGICVARMDAAAGTTELAPALSAGIYVVRATSATSSATLKYAVK